MNSKAVSDSPAETGSAEKDTVIKAAVALLGSIHPWDENDQRIPIWRDYIEGLRQAVAALPPTDES